MSAVRELLQFIDQSPTAFHAVASAVEQLEASGFVSLGEGKEWKIEAGRGYYVTRNQSSIIAFRLPPKTPTHFLISASHTDSPTFKLKSDFQSVAFDQYQRLNTEVYGGTILSSWFDRPLSLAGRVILSENGRMTARLVSLDRDLLVIPNVAIHFNRNINAGYTYNPAVDTLPLFSMGKEASVRALVAQALDCDESAIVGMELYVFNRMKGTVLGASDEFFSAPRIDNLMCMWGTLQGFLKGQSQDAVSVFFAADNEETGSATKQGAGSVFLSDVIDRICESVGVDRRRLLASSMMVSADNAHAKHPNHPELSDAQNAPHMGGGVVIKTNAAQKYTTDALSASVMAAVCDSADVPVQYFSNRSDMAGGSTLGSISNTHVPVMSVDIGMAQLAMHSAYETAGCRDVAYLERAMTAFYSVALQSDCDGSVSISYPNK
ncbi:MAG: M18 family aminopeptidase [Clostridia bacterium]|nr:M18 family aminopeptidase [Clostridia bacterium]